MEPTLVPREDQDDCTGKYDIYSVNDELVNTLTKENRIVPVSYEFSQIKSNAMRVKFVLRFLCKYSRIPVITLRRAKNVDDARYLRQNGNKLFMLKGVNLYKALEMYNQALCMIKCGHSDFSLLLANRSAVYLELRMTDACLTNIRHARLAGYPEKMMDKLVKREMECMLTTTTEFDIANVAPSVCDPVNTVIPFVTSSLEMKESPEFGRYIVATKRHEPGDVLAIEQPFASILLPALRYQRCWNCLEEYEMNLLPCTSCTHAMFCSETCLSSALKTYHQYECPIIDYLLSLFNKLHLIALRTTILSVLAFGSLKNVDAFLQKHGNKKVDAYSAPPDSVELSDIYANDHQRLFHQIYSLETNQEKRSSSDLFQRATICAVMFEQLVNHTPFSKECQQNEKAQNTLIELLYRFLQTSPTNFHSLTLVESNEGEDTYACGAYPFASLINHSCAPNILRASLDRQVIIMALRVIKPGDQLFDNYGYHHCLHSVQSRKNHLQVQYKFVCQCVACKENYPTFDKLPTSPDIPDAVFPEILQRLQEYSKTASYTNLTKFTEYLGIHDHLYPCTQVSSAQECMKMAVSILMKNVPMYLRPFTPAPPIKLPQPPQPQKDAPVRG